MGRRKPFIDKKSATTYSLLYGNSEEQQLQAPDAVQGNGTVTQGRAVDFAPWAPEEVTWDLSEEKRKEIVELGLPDDGYDYLKHLKDPVDGTSSNSTKGAVPEGK